MGSATFFYGRMNSSKVKVKKVFSVGSKVTHVPVFMRTLQSLPGLVGTCRRRKQGLVGTCRRRNYKDRKQLKVSTGNDFQGFITIKRSHDTYAKRSQVKALYPTQDFSEQLSLSILVGCSCVCVIRRTRSRRVRIQASALCHVVEILYALLLHVIQVHPADIRSNNCIVHEKGLHDEELLLK
jgi:hypothetical protein